jgi:hypothetical protein
VVRVEMLQAKDKVTVNSLLESVRSRCQGMAGEGCFIAIRLLSRIKRNHSIISQKIFVCLFIDAVTGKVPVLN